MTKLYIKLIGTNTKWNESVPRHDRGVCLLIHLAGKEEGVTPQAVFNRPLEGILHTETIMEMESK